MNGEVVTDSYWFKELVSKHKSVLITAARSGHFVLVPQTASLSSWRVSSKEVSHHILDTAPPGSPRGEFRTLSGRVAIVTQSAVIAGSGFSDSGRESSILSSSSINVEVPSDEIAGSKSQGKLQLYFISRPLEGGIEAPRSVDELTPDGIRKFLAMLRSAPDAEAAFYQLEAGIREIEKSLRRTKIGITASEAAAFLTEVADGINELCESVCEQIMDSSTFEDDSDDLFARSRQQVMQCLESWCSENLHDLISPILRIELAAEVEDLRIGLLSASNTGKTQEDIGIKRAFRCNFDSVASMLMGLSSRKTPLEKLHCIRDASLTLRGLIEQFLEANKISLDDVDLGADDELPILAWAALRAQALSISSGKAGDGSELPIHFAFAQRFRLRGCGELELSQLGYRLANMEQALGIFLRPLN
jgi:hypothetical protein